MASIYHISIRCKSSKCLFQSLSSAASNTHQSWARRKCVCLRHSTGSWRTYNINSLAVFDHHFIRSLARKLEWPYVHCVQCTPSIRQKNLRNTDHFVLARLNTNVVWIQMRNGKAVRFHHYQQTPVRNTFRSETVWCPKLTRCTGHVKEAKPNNSKHRCFMRHVQQ